jgi:hypothetical protein
MYRGTDDLYVHLLACYKERLDDFLLPQDGVLSKRPSMQEDMKQKIL